MTQGEVPVRTGRPSLHPILLTRLTPSLAFPENMAFLLNRLQRLEPNFESFHGGRAPRGPNNPGRVRRPSPGYVHPFPPY